MVTCNKCKTEIDELAVFPGKICVSCYEKVFNKMVAKNGGILPKPNFKKTLNLKK